MKYFLVALLVFASCKKENNCDTKQVSANATIVWGMREVDGCDWCVRIDSTNYFHPETLDSAFMQDQLPVQIVYTLTCNNYSCGAINGIPIINVVSIEK